MKVLSILTLSATADRSDIMRRLTEELRGSWALYTADVIREAYATDDPTQIVFILEAADLADAKAALERLPLVGSGSFIVQLTALRPFNNWSRLFGTH